MRIIAGRHRGRKLTPPADAQVRPTSDRLRESLFNILAHRPDFTFHGARVADLFAGTGALGLEAASRGAAHVSFVESHPASIDLIRHNIISLGEAGNCRVIAGDARRLPKSAAAFDLVFLDPPYGKDLLPPALDSLAANGWLKPGSLIVAEQGAEEVIPYPDDFEEISTRTQSAAKFVILRYAGTNLPRP